MEGCPVALFSIHREKYYTDLSSSFGQVGYDLHIDHFSGSANMYKYVFAYKKYYKYRKLATEVNLSEVELCHAATLFSDGAIALRLKKDRGIPYIVGVRGTDTTLYAKHMAHLWPMGREILREASCVVFISPSLRDVLFESKPFRGMRNEIMPKTEIIPNGIDDVWLNNIRKYRTPIDITTPKIIYVGVLDENKNVLSLMDAIDKLAEKHPFVHLSIVGGNGSQEERISKRCSIHPERYQMLGKIYDKEILREALRMNDIFAMVSHGETFGLVYVEALSQALPILYSKGRGIDGFFEGKVGEAVNPDSVSDIARGLEMLITNHSKYTILGDGIKCFSWKNLAGQYINMYKNIKI